MIGDLAFLITTGIAFAAIGAVAWRITTGRLPRQDEWPGIALPLGLGIGGTIIGIAASCHSFEAGFGAVAFAAIGSVAFLTFDRPLKSALSGWGHGPNSSAPIAIGAVILILIMPGLFAPVIDGDALCYHLEVAKRMVHDDHVRFDPDLHETAYPLLVESLQAVALKCRGPVATRAISFWFGIALAFGSACLAGSIVKGPSRYWAAVLVLITPVVHCGMISPLNDVALAALCTSSLAAWIVTDHDGISPRRRFALAGAFCGLACGVKFPGIVWLAVFAAYLVSIHVTGKNRYVLPLNRSAMSRFAIFMAFVVMCGSFWYLRAAILTGNPVYPYFRNTFGGHGLDEVLEDARKPPWTHALNIATAPVVMALLPSRFDSFSHQSGPLFLALLPLGCVLKPSKRWLSFVLLGWLLMALCLTQRQSPRFFVATFALWAAAAAAVIDELPRLYGSVRFSKRFRGNFAIGCLCLLSAFVVSFDLARVRVGAMVVAGLVSPHQWLESHEPTAKLRDWTSANLPPEARLVGQDHRAFYWPRRFTMEKAHRRRTGLLQITKSPEETIDRLRTAGFTHLVLAEPDPVDAVEFDIDLSERLAPWIARKSPLIDMTLPEIDGYVRRYRIYEISGIERPSVARHTGSQGDLANVEFRSEARTRSEP